jgi:hypothetical protein
LAQADVGDRLRGEQLVEQAQESGAQRALGEVGILGEFVGPECVLDHDPRGVRVHRGKHDSIDLTRLSRVLECGCSDRVLLVDEQEQGPHGGALEASADLQVPGCSFGEGRPGEVDHRHGELRCVALKAQ